MIKKNALDTLTQTKVVIQGLQEIKAQDIVLLNLKNIEGASTDYFVICTATSDRQAQALADSVEKFMKEKTGYRPSCREGYQEGTWILLDYVDIVVHIFLQDKRNFYRLEALWGDAEREEIPA